MFKDRDIRRRDQAILTHFEEVFLPECMDNDLVSPFQRGKIEEWTRQAIGEIDVACQGAVPGPAWECRPLQPASLVRKPLCIPFFPGQRHTGDRGLQVERWYLHPHLSESRIAQICRLPGQVRDDTGSKASVWKFIFEQTDFNC